LPQSAVKEPRPRKDGTCYVCRGPRKLKGLKPVYRTAAEHDPFCSADCCRAWYEEQRQKEEAA
jgi:hypothetical protein